MSDILASRIQRFRGSFSGYEPNHFFLNGGSGTPFQECGFTYGLAQKTDGRAVAAFDMDGDGGQDLAVQSLQDLKVYRNRLSTRGHFLQLSVLDEDGHPAIDAEVTLKIGEKKVIDRVRMTAGFHTQVSPRLHLGLGDSETAESVTVRWPSGTSKVYEDLPKNSHVQLREGQSEPLLIPRPSWSSSHRPDPPATIQWGDRVKTLDGSSIPLVSQGQPSIINLWAPWCTSCVSEIPHLRAFMESTQGALPRVIGVVVDPKSPQSVRDFMSQHGMTYPQTTASKALIDALFPDGNIRLPTTLIFDDKARLIKRYKRVVTLKDLQSIYAVLHQKPTMADHIHQAELHMKAGQYSDAYLQFKSALKHDPTRVHLLRRALHAATQSGELNGQTETLRALHRLRPKDVHILGQFVQVHLAAEGPKRTLTRLDNSPFTADLAWERIHIYQIMGDVDAARSVLEDALRQFPNHPRLQEKKARLKGGGAPQ